MAKAEGNDVYVSPAGGPGSLPRQVSLLDPVTGRKRPWKTLAPSDPTGVTAISLSTITPDGRAYDYTFARRLSDLYVIQNVM